MKTLKNLSLVILAAGTLAACSSTRTGTGAGDSSMTSGSGSGSVTDSAGMSGTTEINSSGGYGTGTTTTDSVSNTTVGSENTNNDNNAIGSTGNMNSSDITNNPGSNPAYGTGSGNAGTSERGSNGMESMSSSSYSSAEQFISAAARANMKEIELSNLALQKANNPDVRAYAEKMVREHSEKNQQLMSLATSKGITLPDMSGMGAGSPSIGNMSGSGTINSNSDQNNNTESMNSVNSGSVNKMGDNTLSQTMNELQNLSGAAFDKSYMETMVRNHEQAVALFTNASQSNNKEIKAFAMKSLPALRAHLYDARQINDRINP